MRRKEVSRVAGVVGGRRKSAAGSEDVAYVGEDFESVGGILRLVRGNLHVPAARQSPSSDLRCSGCSAAVSVKTIPFPFMQRIVLPFRQKSATQQIAWRRE